MAYVELDRWKLKLAQTLGYTVGFDAELKQAHCVLNMDELHTNPRGTIHGGVSAIMLDTAGGLTASLSEDPSATMPALTLSLSINYVSAVSKGELRAIGRVTGGGRSTKFVDCELRDEAGTLVASSTGVFRLIREPKSGRDT